MNAERWRRARPLPPLASLALLVLGACSQAANAASAADGGDAGVAADDADAGDSAVVDEATGLSCSISYAGVGITFSDESNVVISCENVGDAGPKRVDYIARVESTSVVDSIYTVQFSVCDPMQGCAQRRTITVNEPNAPTLPVGALVRVRAEIKEHYGYCHQGILLQSVKTWHDVQSADGRADGALLLAAGETLAIGFDGAPFTIDWVGLSCHQDCAACGSCGFGAFKFGDRSDASQATVVTMGNSGELLLRAADGSTQTVRAYNRGSLMNGYCSPADAKIAYSLVATM